MKKCLKCGKSINSIAKVCPYCNTKCSGGRFLNQAARKSHKGLWGGIFIFVMLLLAGRATVYFLNSKETIAQPKDAKQEATVPDVTTIPSIQFAMETEETESLYTEVVEKRLISIQGFDSGELQEEYQFVYNKKGQVQGAVRYYYENGQILSQVSKRYTYDLNGNLIKAEHIPTEGVASSEVYQFEFDEGRIFGYQYTETYGNQTGYSVYYSCIYDAQGNLTGKIADDGSYDAKYSYDEENQAVTEYANIDWADDDYLRTNIYDCSYAPLIISTCSINESAWANGTSKAIAFMPNWNLTDITFVLQDDYAFATDENGYLIMITDSQGENILAFQYEDIINKEDESGAALSFTALPETFTFTSGVGGWATQITIASDGAFDGEYHDSEMGDKGDGYPNGSVYYCNFSGKFSEPIRVNEYTYKMTLEFIEVKNMLGEEYIENEVRYIASEPYGFDDSQVYYIYLPGTPAAYMPEDCFNWVSRLCEIDDVYVICGDEGELPFIGEREGI